MKQSSALYFIFVCSVYVCISSSLIRESPIKASTKSSISGDGSIIMRKQDGTTKTQKLSKRNWNKVSVHSFACGFTDTANVQSRTNIRRSEHFIVSMIQHIFTWINSVAAPGIGFAIRVHYVAIMLPEFHREIEWTEPKRKGKQRRHEWRKNNGPSELLLMHIVLYKQIHWVNIQCIRIQNEAQRVKQKLSKCWLLKCVLW